MKLRMTIFFWRKLLIILTSVAISGCATNGVLDYASVGVDTNVVREPSRANGYTGVLVEISPSAGPVLENRAAEICARYKGLKIKPTYIHSAPIGWKFFSYQCVGEITPSKTPPVIIQQQIPIRNNIEVQSVVEREVTPTNISPPLIERLSIDASKKKCTELGFKLATEGHGKCVLQLSK